MTAPEPLRLAFLGDPNSVHTRRWMRFFADAGHAVALLDGYGFDIRPGLDERIVIERYTIPTRRRGLSALAIRRALRQAIYRFQPHVLHAHYVSRYGWQARLSGFHPYVVSAWGSDVHTRPYESLRARVWTILALRGADLVTVVNEPMRQAVRSLGAPADRISLVQHGVDTTFFKPGRPNRRFLGRLGLEPGRYLLSPRGIAPVYRQRTVVEAFARLPSDGLRLVLSARNADQAELTRVRGRAVRLGVDGRLVILDEIEEDSRLHVALYRGAAAVISVPERDSFPVTAQEAMATGTPLVLSDLAPAREVLGPIDPALLVPVGDAEALASAVRRVLDMDAEARRALGARLREHVVREADYRTNMQRMESLYRALATRR